MQQQNKELFQNYEIRNWNFSPRLYKIMGAAAIFNLLTILVLGQTNILTTRGCDTAFVSSICQVIDTVYVGSALFGTDSAFESRNYEKTELEDADITYIDVSGQTPPLQYPEGYFALANPEEFAAMQNATGDFSNFPSTIPGIPGIPTNPTIDNGTNLMNMPQVTPTPNNNAIMGDLPTSEFSISPNPVPAPKMNNGIKSSRTFPRKPPKMKNSSPNKLPNFEDKTTAKNKEKSEEKTEDKQPDISSLPVDESKLNKKPLEDFVNNSVLPGLAKTENKLDLSKPFLVVMEGAITKDGKLDKDPKKSKFIRREGDEEMIDVAKAAIEAVGDSGMLGYLRDLGVEKVNFTFVQDDKQIYAIISSDQPSEAKARTVSSGLNFLLNFAKGSGKVEEDVKTLLNSAKVEPKGKSFVLNFTIPKLIGQEMINRKLQEAEANKKAEQNKPNSTAQTVNTNQQSK